MMALGRSRHVADASPLPISVVVEPELQNVGFNYRGSEQACWAQWQTG